MNHSLVRSCRSILWSRAARLAGRTGRSLDCRRHVSGGGSGGPSRGANAHSQAAGEAGRSSTSTENVREYFRTASMLVRFGAGAYVFQVYVMNSTMCIGPSMLPTLNVRGDVLLTEYLSPRFSLLKSGDVVVATKPNDTSVTVIKRIRGMEGEKIWVRKRSGSEPSLITVPQGHVWLEGDNPQQSRDSREYGPVPLALVHGRIICRFWPLSEACFVASQVIDHTKADRPSSAASGDTSSSGSPDTGVASEIRLSSSQGADWSGGGKDIT